MIEEYDNFLNKNSLQDNISNLNVHEKIAMQAIDSDKLESNIVVKSLRTAKHGERVLIQGNDIYLYDASIGGTDPVTGKSANIFFPRTDDETYRFVMTARKGTNHINESVMEMYHDKAAATGGRNYLFLGLDGMGYKPNTNVIRFHTNEAYLFTNESGGQIAYYNTDFPDQNFETGGTRMLLAPRQTTTGSAMNWGTGGGGAMLALGIFLNDESALGIYQFLDSEGTWFASHILPYGPGLIDIGNSSNYANNIRTNTLIANSLIRSNSDGTAMLGTSSNAFGGLYVHTIYPGISGTSNIGTSSKWFNEIHYKTLVSHSLVEVDEKTSAIEKIKKIKKGKEKNEEGEIYLDKKSFPKDVYIEAKNKDERDGLNINNLISVMLNSIKELDNKMNDLQKQLDKLNN